MIVALFALIGLVNIDLAHAEGRTYVPKEELAHCTLWDTILQKWPSTSLGLEPRECRRRATAPTTSNTITCRLTRQYIDPDTSERMCVFERGAYKQGELIIPMDKFFQCPKTNQCQQSLGE